MGCNPHHGKQMYWHKWAFKTEERERQMYYTAKKDPVFMVVSVGTQSKMEKKIYNDRTVSVKTTFLRCPICLFF